MKPINKAINSLKSTFYLESLITHNKKFCNVKLLSNGILYAKQLKSYWRHTQDDTVASNEQKTEANNKQLEYENRLQFLKTSEFYCNIKKFSSDMEIKRPTAIKSIIKADVSYPVPFLNMDDLCIQSVNETSTQLICDYFINSERGIEKFHNIQRERKIWWMRCSANPSRYFIENYDLPYVETHYYDNCQSVDIKARFPYGLANIEHVTMAFLDKPKILQKYALTNSTAIIRSVINLEAATCAMLLDACDHNRDLLFLHRKLAPIQCTVACLHANNCLEDLRDLCDHLSFVIRNSSLRLLTENNMFTDSMAKLETYWQYTDNLGIPYVILVNEESLRTGLLELRSRDTTLSEIIHISDIPNYLYNIFYR